ncbi:MAG: hypothetical protein IJ371_03615 [Clostridia bacterium]|nr:hypothetical protein [Clostridia bacterium]
MLNNTSLNPNLTEVYKLQISDKEHGEIADKTIGRVIERLGQEREK